MMAFDHSMKKTILLTAITSIALISGIILGSIFTSSTASAQGSVPDWVKNNARWWADGQLSEKEFLNGIEWLINEKIITVAAAQGTDQTTVDDLWVAINDLQTDLNSIQDTITSEGIPGPQGTAGPSTSSTLIVIKRTSDPVNIPAAVTSPLPIVTGEATCNFDEVVVAGYHQITTNAPTPALSPTVMSSQASDNGWDVTIQSNQGQINILTVTAMCAKLGP